MPENYHNFDLELTWRQGEPGETGRVSVRYGLENISAGPTPYSGKSGFGAVNQLSELMSGNVNKEKKVAELVEAGRQLADLLLPDGEIRKLFRNCWQHHDRLRLRLMYRADDEGLKQLLKIPWEYVYLKKQADDNDDLTCFLGLRDNISMVHCLPQSEIVPAEAVQASVAGLKVDMKYFSCLGLGPKGVNVDDNRIFQNFLGEFDRLKSVINCSTLSETGSASIETHKEVYPEPYDVIMALKNDQFIHLTCHGEPDEIWLRDSSLTSRELLNHFKLTRDRPQAKVVVLLSCNSGDGARSIAATLHQLGVPLVIGMTRWIGLEDAGRFVDGFYKAIAARPSQSLEKAIIQGRLSMLKESVIGNEWYAGFGMPRLFLNPHLRDSVLIPERLLFGSAELVNGFDHHISRLINETDKSVRSGALDADAIQASLYSWVQQDRGAPEQGWYLVAGTPGSDKSTPIALLLDRLKREDKPTNPKVIYHFCRPELPQTGSPLAFIRDSLVPQLAKHFDEAYSQRFDKNQLEAFGRDYYAWCRPGKFPLLVGNADDAFRYFVLEPLRTLKAMNETLAEPAPLPLIVIDGIDFVPPTHHPHNSILHLLLRYRDELDEVARFLFTADLIDKDETPAAEGTEPAPEKRKLALEDILRLTYHYNEPPDLTIGFARQRENAIQ